MGGWFRASLYFILLDRKLSCSGRICEGSNSYPEGLVFWNWKALLCAEDSLNAVESSAVIVRVIREWISGPPPKRFPIGARVQVKNLAMNGVVVQFDDSPTALGEYWHGIQTRHGELREPGCNLEPIPEPKT